jgi:ABC-type phosphate transport system substrate-binding protein
MQTKNFAMKRLSLKWGLAIAMLAAGVFRAAALDQGIVIVQNDVPVSNLTADGLKDILTGKTAYWSGGQAVVIVTMGDKSDASIQEACGMSASQFKTFWQRLAFSGRGQQPKVVDDVAKAVAMVADVKGAIAIVPANSTLQGVKKVEVK